MHSVGNIYFASDFHLGIPNAKESLLREKKIVKWLENSATDADEIFLVGDIFDFWFEYKYVVPKGFSRLLGCLAKVSDAGVKLRFFRGNHDMWMFDYFESEFGATLYSNEYIFEKSGKKFYVHHGDGLGNGDYLFKFLKKFFRSKICQTSFAFLHPSIGLSIGNYLSSKSRLAQEKYENENIVVEKEWLVQYCNEILKNDFFDYLIFGHRHLALDIKLNEKSRYINLGDWFKFCTYAVFNGNDLELKRFEN
ncbi:MAG: UDP-2,3-diacylglucosamine diphosphatase [Bacteroidetes bacterium]|nr:UDP-2,3-diacylglucosamine diphosphatase [Bacteroidota bacterium]